MKPSNITILVPTDYHKVSQCLIKQVFVLLYSQTEDRRKLLFEGLRENGDLGKGGKRPNDMVVDRPGYAVRDFIQVTDRIAQDHQLDNVTRLRVVSEVQQYFRHQLFDPLVSQYPQLFEQLDNHMKMKPIHDDVAKEWYYHCSNSKFDDITSLEERRMELEEQGLEQYKQEEERLLYIVEGWALVHLRSPMVVKHQVKEEDIEILRKILLKSVTEHFCPNQVQNTSFVRGLSSKVSSSTFQLS